MIIEYGMECADYEDLQFTVVSFFSVTARGKLN